MRFCPSCRAEAGEYHLPSCENTARDGRGRFIWMGMSDFAPQWNVPSPRPIPDIESTLHGGVDDEGDER